MKVKLMLTEVCGLIFKENASDISVSAIGRRGCIVRIGTLSQVVFIIRYIHRNRE